MTKQFVLAACLIMTLTMSAMAAKPNKPLKPSLFAGQGIMMGELTSTSIHAEYDSLRPHNWWIEMFRDATALLICTDRRCGFTPSTIQG